MSHKSKDQAKEVLPKNINDGIGTSIVIYAGWLITAIVVVAFVCLSWNKDIWKLALNEIGDSFAGFASCLAFMWLVITVLLQKTELRLQREEVSGLRGATENQANSLEITAMTQARTYLAERQRHFGQRIIEINKESSDQAVEFLRKYAKHPYPEEFHRKQNLAIKYIISAFLKKDVMVRDIKDLKLECIKDDFCWKSAELFEDQIYHMQEVWKIIKPLREYAVKSKTQSEQTAWEASHQLEWYERYYPLMAHVNSLIREKISMGGIAPDFTTQMIRAYVETEKDKEAPDDTWLL